MHRSNRICAAVTAIVVCSVGGVAAKPPKAASLAACPAWGAENKGSSRAALNEVKKHVPPPGSAPIVLTFADLAPLQLQADARVKSGPGAKVSAKARQTLKGLDAPIGRVGEGDLVAMVGFMVGKPSANPGESANCYLTGVANNDFEFNIAPHPGDTPYDSVVAEMIPQDRPKGWTLARLRKVAADHRQVYVEGQLMFDTRHVPTPKKGANHDSPRVSTWEIHPVTKMLVCMQPEGGCDPAQERQWTAFDAVPEK
jgi:hypothetical protein